MTLEKDTLPPIRVIVEIPSELALEMQRVAAEAVITGPATPRLI